MIRRPSRLPRRDGKLRRWWAIWRVPMLALVVIAAWWFIYRPLANTGPEDWVAVQRDFGICGVRRDASTQGCVIDGDTIAIGFGEQARRIRLTGFDAPELDGACAVESAKAILARDALHAWLAQGDIEWSGGDDPPYDQYGRELREARRVLGDGRRLYLADTMIGTDLAAKSGWGTTSRDWCR